MSQFTDHHINSIYVSHLFGRHTYELPSSNESLSDLNIIYGENGKGKTTLLNLVFHLLSPADKRGHKTRISQIPFAELVVTLNDGTKLTATKDKQLLTGPVKFIIEDGRSERIIWNFSPSIDDSHITLPEDFKDIDIKKIPAEIRKEVIHAIDKRRYFDRMGQLKIDTLMLTSDRILMGDTVQEPPKSEPAKQKVKVSDLVYEHRIAVLSNAIATASHWLSKRFLEPSYGGRTIADPYLDVVKKIAKTTNRTKSGLKPDQEAKLLAELSSKIGSLEVKSKGLTQFGLNNTSAPTDLIPIINTTKGNRLHLINTILSPHLEVLEAKFTALSEIVSVTEKFLKTANNFFKDKQLKFNLNTGLRILADSPQGQITEIQPHQLSSGEQQLLLMLCHVLVAQDESTVFIIDEPEISLNILWQRMLVSALQGLSKDKKLQLIFASHSLEILSKHRNRVLSIQGV